MYQLYKINLPIYSHDFSPQDFERGRIRALQEERMYIQKKTFTKWMNSFLQKARMEVEDLFVDLADGRKLLKLLEIISGDHYYEILRNL